MWGTPTLTFAGQRKDNDNLTQQGNGSARQFPETDWEEILHISHKNMYFFPWGAASICVLSQRLVNGTAERTSLKRAYSSLLVGLRTTQSSVNEGYWIQYIFLLLYLVYWGRENTVWVELHKQFFFEKAENLFFSHQQNINSQWYNIKTIHILKLMVHLISVYQEVWIVVAQKLDIRSSITGFTVFTYYWISTLNICHVIVDPTKDSRERITLRKFSKPKTSQFVSRIEIMARYQYNV